LTLTLIQFFLFAFFAGNGFVLRESKDAKIEPDFKIEELDFPLDDLFTEELVRKGKSIDIEELNLPVDSSVKAETLEELIQNYDSAHNKPADGKAFESSKILIDGIEVPDLESVKRKFRNAQDAFNEGVEKIVEEFPTTVPSVSLDLDPVEPINTPILETIEKIKEPEIRKVFEDELPNITDEDEQRINDTDNFVVEDIQPNTFVYNPEYDSKVPSSGDLPQTQEFLGDKPDVHEKEQLSVHLVEQIVNMEQNIDSTTIIPEADLIGDHNNIENQTIQEVLDHIAFTHNTSDQHNSSIVNQSVDPMTIIPNDRHVYPTNQDMPREPEQETNDLPYVNTELKNDKFVGFGGETDLVRTGEETTEADKFFVSSTTESSETKNLVEEVIEEIGNVLDYDLQNTIDVVTLIGAARSLNMSDNSTEKNDVAVTEYPKVRNL
jgi:hypothetical protein